MRTSPYVIYIHNPWEDDYYIVHSYTGAVDKVSPDVVKFLLDRIDPRRVHRRTKDEEIARKSLEGRETQEISGYAKRRLHERGYLTEKTLEEETAYVERLARWIHRRNVDKSSPAFMLVPMYECNLRCPYCFEKETRIRIAKKSKAALRRVMSREQIDDVFTTMQIITDTRHGGTRSDSIRLYGGEPMADMTREAIGYLVERGGQEGYRFSAVTNAVDLHLFLDLLGPGMIESLQITFDGPRHIHDRKRIGPLHKKTYDRILRNLDLVVGQGKEVHITLRVHADKVNVGVLSNLVDDLESHGLTAKENVEIVTETTSDFKAHDEDYNSTFPHPTMRHDEAHSQLAESDPNLLPVLNVNDLGVGDVLTRYIKHKLPGIMSRVEPCAAVKGQYVFDPNGRIYTCWEDVGVRGKEIGTFDSQGPTFNQLAEDWRRRSPAEIHDCKTCKYAFFHFSGCAAVPMAQKDTVFARACYDYEESFIHFSRLFFRWRGAQLLQAEPQAPQVASALPGPAESASGGR